MHAKGIEERKADHLHYTAPADDGSVQERDEDGKASSEATPDTSGMSRAERRAAAKKKGKRG